MSRSEAVILSIGAVVVCIALATFDPRLGLLALGVCLIAASIDLRRPA